MRKLALKIKNLFLVRVFLLISLITLFSCNQTIKKQDTEEFDRQSTDASIDDLLIGDDTNYWGSDSPRGAIFIFRAKADFLKGIGLKPIRFKEGDKTIEELAKKIDTDPIYQIEVYSLPKPEKIDYRQPQICDYISDNFQKANLVKLVNKVSLRLKERNWIPINAKIQPNDFIFVRIGVGEMYSTIKNRATDAFWINAKKSEKNWEDMSKYEKDKILAWTCGEYNFMESNVIQGAYYNPDIVFNFSTQ